MDEYNWFGWRKTKRVEGGIKARATRFGESWWSGLWLEVLRNSGSRNRLARGRTYARKGQITEFQVIPGTISAMVQGSADEPYSVEIALRVIPQETAERILRSMQRSPLVAATLLNQEMPREILQIFENESERLFPASQKDLKTDCSCPDTTRICKHVAAVFYLFSLQLDRDPLLLLQLRGIDRQALLSEARVERLFSTRPKKQRQPLPADPAAFWRGSRIPATTLRSETPLQHASLVKQMGSFPLWRGENDFLKVLEQMYAAATGRALQYLNHKEH